MTAFLVSGSQKEKTDNERALLNNHLKLCLLICVLLNIKSYCYRFKKKDLSNNKIISWD